MSAEKLIEQNFMEDNMSNEIREQILNGIKKQTERVKKVTDSYEYEVLLSAIKDPKLDIVQEYFQGEKDVK